MGDPFRILTVCVGNMCRSPLAERLLRLRLGELSPADSFQVTSAGTRAPIGEPMEELAIRELVRRGGEPAGHAARRLQASLVDEADLILTATREVRSAVLAEQPRAMRRTFTLSELAYLSDLAPIENQGTAAEFVSWATAHRSLAARVELDLKDPIGQSAAVHREVADRIDQCVRKIAEALSRTPARHSH